MKISPCQQPRGVWRSFGRMAKNSKGRWVWKLNRWQPMAAGMGMGKL